MLTIKGTENTALCFADNIEEGAINQIKRMCSYSLTKGNKIRIMPDVHEGKGCTIGTTMTISDRVCPNIVGVDIGCGMYTVELNEKEINLPDFDDACHYIPSGHNVWEGRIERFDLTKLKCYRSLRRSKRLQRSLGTLGGGNHFIEIDKSSDGALYMIIHTGSRNLGKQVAEVYQQLAIDLHCGKEDYFRKKNEIIKTYKQEGRKKEIQGALDELKKEYVNNVPNVPKELCWLYGDFLEDYLHDIEICQSFAKRNRELIAEVILERTGLTKKNSFHTIHNYIDTESMILRKGAISAKKDELLLIPLNMRDGSILAKGKGNPDWNFSAPHGAGRLMSRSEAVKKLFIKDFEDSMKGIYTTSVSEVTLDEAPMAYKPAESIIDTVDETVEIIEVIKPIYNFKA